MWSHVRHPHDCLSHEGESHCYALSKSSNCSKVQDTCLQPTIVCAICSIAGVDHLFHGARILVWRYLGCEAQIRPFPLLDLLRLRHIRCPTTGYVFTFANDIGKAKQAAGELQMLFDKVPSIDTWSQDGLQLMSAKWEIEFRKAKSCYPTRDLRS